jgi:phage terminase small subunit
VKALWSVEAIVELIRTTYGTSAAFRAGLCKQNASPIAMRLAKEERLAFLEPRQNGSTAGSRPENVHRLQQEDRSATFQ